MRITPFHADIVLKELAFAPPRAVKKLNQGERELCMNLFHSREMLFPDDIDFIQKASQIREKLFSVRSRPENRLIRLIVSIGKCLLNVFGFRISSKQLEKERDDYLRSLGVISSEVWDKLATRPLQTARVTLLTDLKGGFQRIWNLYADQNRHIVVIDTRNETHPDLWDEVTKAAAEKSNGHIFVIVTEEEEDRARQVFYKLVASRFLSPIRFRE